MSHDSLHAQSLGHLVDEVVAEAFHAGLSDSGWMRSRRALAVRTPHELTRLRDDTRRLLEVEENPFAAGAAAIRVNYVVGDGFRYHVDPIHPERDQVSADAVSLFAAAFVELNALSEMEAETVYRVDRDGEAFLRLFIADGIPEVRFIEPERVRPPADRRDDPAHQWGIATDPLDARRVLGYWVEETPGESPTLVPEEEVVHVRFAPDSAFPRARPTFSGIAMPLRRCEELLAAMTATGKARAKLALIRKTSLTRDVADRLTARLTTKYQDQPDGSPPKLTSVEELPYGAVLRIDREDDVILPSPGVGSEDLVAIVQANLRAAGARLQMPEWMFTGLANAKYSNAQVAEAPTLKMFRRMQKTLAQAFGEGRLRGQASLLWRAIKLGVRSGELPHAVLDAVRIGCTPPSLEIRDRKSEAELNALYVKLGVKSLRTVREELGLDPDKEASRIAAESIRPE